MNTCCQIYKWEQAAKAPAFFPVRFLFHEHYNQLFIGSKMGLAYFTYVEMVHILSCYFVFFPLESIIMLGSFLNLFYMHFEQFYLSFCNMLSQSVNYQTQLYISILQEETREKSIRKQKQW